MPKPSNREKILSEGLRVVHQRGFANASVRDIVQAAGVPQGSFTNHFASKEAFGLEIIDLYLENGRKGIKATLLNDALPPLQRLVNWIDTNRNRGCEDSMRNGCLLGNFTAEASDHSEVIRERLVEIFSEIQQAIFQCLEAAENAGEIPQGKDLRDVAAFTLASMQGASLMAKAQRDPAPMDRFKRILFSSILR